MVFNPSTKVFTEKSLLNPLTGFILSNFGIIGLTVNKNPNCETFPIIAAITITNITGRSITKKNSKLLITI